MIADAVISADGQYRYRLERQWGTDPTMKTATWVMLNGGELNA